MMGAILVILLSGGLAAVPDDKPKDPTAAFNRALARAVGVNEPAQAAAAQAAFLALGKPAEELAAVVGPRGVPELAARLAKAPPRSAEWKLAALTLAHLSADPPARRALTGGESIPGGLITVSFMPPDVRRQLLAELLAGGTALPSDEVAELLAAVGDQDSRARLQKFLETADVSPDRRPRVERAADALDRRLKLPTAAERDALAKEELLFWRAVAEPAPDRGLAEPRHLPSLADRPLRNAAMLGHLKMSLPVPFLRAKLEQFGPAPVVPLPVQLRIQVEVEFAAAIAGVQREAGLIQELARAATAPGTDGRPARQALGMIGTDRSLRTLEALPDPERTGLSEDVGEALAEYGDRASVAALTRLAADARYPEATRRAFAAAQVRLEKRLAGVKTVPPDPPGAAKRP